MGSWQGRVVLLSTLSGWLMTVSFSRSFKGFALGPRVISWISSTIVGILALIDSSRSSWNDSSEVCENFIKKKKKHCKSSLSYKKSSINK